MEASSGQSVSAAVGLPNRVYAGGMPVGIYLETDGVLVVGTGSVMDISGEERTPSGGCLQPGDYILAVNGHSVTDKEEIVQMVKENECQPVALTIRRGEKMEKVEVEPVQTAEMEYRLGLWIRDDTQGIGTVTYITEDGQFAALGHGISDPDTGKRIESTGGDLYLAQIHSIAVSYTHLPVDGHDINQMIHAFHDAKRLNRTVVVHVMTHKGQGYAPAENNPEAFHGVGSFVLETGKAVKKTSRTYTDVFSQVFCAMAKKDSRLVGILSLIHIFAWSPARMGCWLMYGASRWRSFRKPAV